MQEYAKKFQKLKLVKQIARYSFLETLKFSLQPGIFFITKRALANMSAKNVSFLGRLPLSYTLL